MNILIGAPGLDLPPGSPLTLVMKNQGDYVRIVTGFSKCKVEVSVYLSLVNHSLNLSYKDAEGTSVETNIPIYFEAIYDTDLVE